MQPKMQSKKKYRAKMRAKHGPDWWKSKGGPKLRGSSVWTLTPTGKLGYETGVSYTKKVVATSKGPDFVGTAWAEPRQGFGRWPFDIYKVGGGPGEAGFFVKDVDFPENRGPHPTLKATFEAIQQDAFLTGT